MVHIYFIYVFDLNPFARSFVDQVVFIFRNFFSDAAYYLLSIDWVSFFLWEREAAKFDDNDEIVITKKD